MTSPDPTGVRHAEPPSRVRWRGALFGVSALILALAIVLPSMSLLNQPFPGFLAWDNGVLMSLHRDTWSGARAGLPLNGGIVTGIEGAPFQNGRALWEAVSQRPVGTPIRYEVLSPDGASRSYVVETIPLSTRDYLATFGIYLLNGIALLIVGALALWLRPDLAAARALAFSTGILGALLLLAVDYVTTFGLGTLCRLAEGLSPVALMSLAVSFPRARGTPWLRRGFLAVLAAIGVGSALFVSIRFHEDPALSRQFASAAYLGIALALLALIASQTHALLRSPTDRARRQAAVVFAGFFPAFALAAFGMLFFILLDAAFSWSLAFALLPLAPASMLYAMVRQNLFDAERLVRLSAGYTLTTITLLAAFPLVLALVDAVLVGDVSLDPGLSFVLVLSIALVFDPLRVGIQRQVDRMFYRSRVDAARELEGLSAMLARLNDEEGIVSYVASRVQEALGLEWAELAIEATVPGAESGEGGERAEPVDVGSERAELVGPVEFGGERLASIVCGPKLSGAPFSPDEHALVRGIGDQAALALHNARTYQNLREAEETLRVQERLAAMGEFAASIAHGLRNPLSSIRLATEVGELDADPNNRLTWALRTVRQEADRLEGRVRSLLRYAQPYEPVPELLDLGAIVRAVADSARPLAERQDVSLTLRVQDAALGCRADGAQVREALLELVTNALAAMPGGGELGLETDLEAGLVVARVRDSGPGITPREQSRVFDLFHTTRTEGSGVGLASVKKIAEANGGKVVLESSGPSGSCFRLEFPEADPREPGSRPSGSS